MNILWKQMKVFFDEKISNRGIDDTLSLNDQRIIRFLNVGAFIAGLFCLIVSLLNLIFISDPRAVFGGIFLAIVYFIIVYSNGFKLFSFTKILVIFFLTGVVISWNLFILETPYFIILPFTIASVFYARADMRLIYFILFFILFSMLKYFPFDKSALDFMFYDFFLFLTITILISFVHNNMKFYENKMMELNESLKAQNKILEEQQKLKKSEQFFRSIYENNQIGILVIDANYQLQNVNPAFCKQLGYTEEELFNLKLRDLNVSKEKCSAQFMQLIRGEIRNYEAREQLYKADGSIMQTEMILNGVYDIDGAFIEAVVTVQDITIAYHAQEAIAASEAKFKALFDYSPVGITIRNIKTDEILDINQTALDRLGMTRAEFFEQGKEAILNPRTDIESDAKILQSVIDGKVNVITTEKLFKDKKGNDLYAEIIRSKVLIGDDAYIVAISRDITQIKIIEEERRIRYLEMQTFFDALPISFLYFDNDDRIIRANPLSSGGKAANIEGQLMKDIYPTFSEKEVTIHETIRKTKNSILNKIEQHTFGEYVLWVKVDRIPVKDDSGEVIGIIAFSTDITEIKRTEEALAIKNAELKHYIETNLQLESFAYIASHDLKEPLRMIHSFTQLLHRKLKSHFDTDSLEYMNFILDGVNRMQNLLDDLLRYSTIGRQETDMELTDLNDTIYNVIQNVQHTIKEKSAVIMTEPLPSIKVFPMQMVQLFQNLISNALKFTSKDREPLIEITVQQTKTEYLFAVRDNGIGIQKEYLEKIFLVFKRLHSKEEYAGTGIGLATCKKIVDSLGGRIWVESSYGESTTFFFTIPNINL